MPTPETTSVYVPTGATLTGTASQLDAYVNIYSGTPSAPSTAPIHIALRPNAATTADVLDLSDELDARGADIDVQTGDRAVYLTMGAGSDVIRFNGTSLSDVDAPAQGRLDGGAGFDTLRIGYADVSRMSVAGIESMVWTGGLVTATVGQLEGLSVITSGVSGGSVTLRLANGGALDLAGELGSQSATIYGSAYGNAVTLGSGGDRFYGAGGNDTALGGAGNDTLSGGAGNDWLDGGVGNDRLEGGLGDDTYVVTAGTDTIVEAAGGGVDTVRIMASHTLAANFENLTLTGTGAFKGVGNAVGNTIVGNGAANVLQGLGGNDVLAGGAGDDLLQGGTGNDALVGGAGADTFCFEDGRDSVTDWQNNVDTLAFDDALWGGGPRTASQILAYGHMEGTSAVFDFGNGDVFTVRGAGSLASLSDDLAIY